MPVYECAVVLVADRVAEDDGPGANSRFTPEIVSWVDIRISEVRTSGLQT